MTRIRIRPVVLILLCGGVALAVGPPDDNVLIGNGTTWETKAIPSCSTAGSALNYTTATNVLSCNTAVAASTAAALAANGANCSGNNFALGVDAAGAAECAQPAFTNLTGTASIAQGGTTLTASVEDAVMVGSSTTAWQAKVLPDCVGTGKALNYTVATNTFTCDTNAAPNFTQQTIDFGVSSVATTSLVVTGQAWVTSSSIVVCVVTGHVTTDRAEGSQEAILNPVLVQVSDLVAGTGFTLKAGAWGGMTGKFKVNCVGN